MHRRNLAIAAVTFAMFAVIGLVAFSISRNGGSRVDAWVMVRDLHAGDTIDAGSVQRENFPQDGTTASLEHDSPIGHTVAHALHASDVLRPDDLLTQSMVQVPITFKTSPGLSAGDVVDIFVTAADATSAGGVPAPPSGVRLLARGVSVGNIGGTTVINVPIRDEAYWVTVAVSGTPLTAARSTGVGAPAAGHTYQLDEAVHQLMQSEGNGAQP